MDTETIKERLNLHVKRRLKSSETATESSHDAVRSKIHTPPPAKAKVATINSNKSPKKGRMSKKPMSSSSESINSTITPCKQSTSSIAKTMSSSKAPVTFESPTISPQMANNNNEGEHEISSVEKQPDILTTVLNDKKLQLMQDPEVLNFLSNIIGLYTAAKMSK